MSSVNSIPAHARHCFYTYIHRRLDSGLIFYVGKGAGTRGSSKNGRNIHWQRVVSAHGFSIEVVGLWESEDDAFSHERLLISIFRDLGHPLVNKTDGGEGASGLVVGEETRRRHSESMRALRERDPDFDQRRVAALIASRRTEDGRKIHSAAMSAHRTTDAARARQSELTRARWNDPETRAATVQRMRDARSRIGYERIAAASRMKFQDPAVKSKVVQNLIDSNILNGRKVLCLTDGRVFESVADAADKLGVSRSCVTAACGGKQKTTAGVRLVYLDSRQPYV